MKHHASTRARLLAPWMLKKFGQSEYYYASPETWRAAGVTPECDLDAYTGEGVEAMHWIFWNFRKGWTVPFLYPSADPKAFAVDIERGIKKAEKIRAIADSSAAEIF